MLSKKAIDDYLNRKLNSFAWLKKTPREDLLRALEEIDSPPWIYLDLTDMWTNQLAMLLAGIYMPEFLFLCDMGTGKTRVILDLFRYRKASGEKNCWLVCVLDKANIENWLAEIRKFAPDLTVKALNDKSTRKNISREKADIFLVHYAGLISLCSDLQQVKKTKKRKWMINTSRIHLFQRKFTGLVMDECTEVGNPQAIRARICYRLGKFMKYKYGLTGTPFGRDPKPLWNQFKIIDDGETLGSTLGLFREVFYRKERHFWSGGHKFIFRRRMKKELHRIIANRSITYTEGECQDLPERVHIKRTVILPDYMESYYKKELANLRRSKGNFREVKNSFLRMRQLASGFLGIKDDETGAKAEIEFPENPKLEDLLHVIDELPSRAKMIIYHEYIWSGNRISREMKAREIDHERLHGGQKDQGQALRRFLEDPKCRYLVSNNRFSMGLNLQVATYEYFFESSVRPIIRQQAERRIRRGGQTADRTFIIDPIARSVGNNHSIDERILDLLAQGKNLLRDVLSGKEKL